MNDKIDSKEDRLIPVKGLSQATCCSETKYLGRDDLLLIVMDKNSSLVGCLTKSTAPSAPVIWNKEKFKTAQKSTDNIVLLVNAGNANAFTGADGIKACVQKAEALSKIFKCHLSNIFFASTGVIGEKLPVDKIINQFEFLKNTLSINNFYSAAASILTTDTQTKTFSKRFKFGKKIFTISGFAKGSGMIFPNMATMLAFIFTDYSIEKKNLSKFTKKAVDNSFNKISEDGDTSTSDSVFVGSTNKLKIEGSSIETEKGDKLFYEKLESVMVQLAKLIVLDGEGASKFIEVMVKNAKTKLIAKEIAFSIANSLLVKTAIAGEDANWGRIIMAIGKTGKPFKMDKVEIYIQGELLTENGCAKSDVNERNLKKKLEDKSIKIVINLRSGKQNFTAWTSDLTEEYIKINADYRS